MKSIKIKVKTLILLVAVVVGLTLFAEDIFFTAIDVYNKYADEPVNIADTRLSFIELENKRLEKILTENEHSLLNLVAIGDGMMMGGTRIRYQDGENIYQTFMKTDQEEVFVSSVDYVINVILSQWFSGHTEQAKELLDKIKTHNLTQDQQDQIHLIQIGINLAYFNLDEVISELGELSETYASTKAVIHNFLVIAYAYDADLLENSNSNLRFDAYFTNLTHYNGLDNVNKIKSDKKETISGSVTLNGEAFEGAIVYPSYYSGMSSYEGISNASRVISGNESYEISVNLQALRSVNILVPWQRVHDKQLTSNRSETQVEFNFTDGTQFEYAYIEDNQLYYKILNGKENIEYHMKVQFFEPNLENDQSYYAFKGAEGSISMEELNKHMNFLFNTVSSGDTLNINRFMEHFYLSGTYSLSVKENIDDPNLYVSNGIQSESLDYLVDYDGEELNQGDLLLGEGKVEEAIEWYDSHDSQHNLKVLYALHKWGTIAIDGDYYQTLEGQDPDKALYYLNKLIDQYGETTLRLSNKAMLLKDSGDYLNESKVLERLLDLKYNVYDDIDLAVNKINRKLYSKGLEALDKFDMSVLGERYYEYYILGDVLETLPEDFQRQLKNISNKYTYNVFFKYIKLGEYKAAYEWLLEQEDSDLKSMYQLFYISVLSCEGLELPYEKISDQLIGGSAYSIYYKSVVDQMQSGPIKSLLMSIKKNSGWY